MSAATKAAQQGQAAEEMHKQIFGDPDNTEQAETPETEETTDTTVEATEQVEQTVEGETENVQDKDKNSVVPIVPEETWEQRYRSLQGIHRSRMKAAEIEINDLQGRIQTLESTVQAPAQTETTTQSSGLSAEEIEDYGSDLISVMKRAAREEIQGELSTLRQENSSLRQQLGTVNGTVQQNVKTAMFSQLTSEVPNWRTINDSEGFHFWLEQPDPYSGARRQNLLTQAFDGNDTTRVINFFKGYISEAGAVQPPPTPVDTPATETRQPQVAMENLVAPGKPRGDTSVAQTSTQNDGRVWSEKDIAAFYAKVQKGHYRNYPEEKGRIEREIHDAVQQGRVTR